MPMKAEITGGEASDYKGIGLLRDGSLPRPKVLIADKVHDPNHIRETVSNEGGATVNPDRSNRKDPETIDSITYVPPNHVERCFNNPFGECAIHLPGDE